MVNNVCLFLVEAVVSYDQSHIDYVSGSDYSANALVGANGDIKSGIGASFEGRETKTK